MASFELQFKSSVVGDLERVPRDTVHRVLKACRALAEKRRSRRFRKLASGGLYCFRVDDALVVFEMRGQKVTVLAVVQP